MSKVLRFVAFLLLVSLVFPLVSCTGYNKSITERVNAYLAEEYPGREFAIIDYEKQNETSGRYEINIRCLDDGVDFKMYMYSSIRVTDSYSVERANAMMNEIVSDELGKDLYEKFKNITWHNIYAEHVTNYSFRKIELAENFSLAELDTIYGVKLSSGLREEEIGEVIYDFVYSLCDEPEDDCEIELVEFVFQINRVTYRFKTDSKSILNLGEDGVVYYIITNIEENPSSLREIKLEYLSGETAENN